MRLASRAFWSKLGFSGWTTAWACRSSRSCDLASCSSAFFAPAPPPSSLAGGMRLTRSATSASTNASTLLVLNQEKTIGELVVAIADQGDYAVQYPTP